MSLQNINGYISPQLPVFCGSHPYFQLYNSSLWSLFFYPFAQTFQMFSLYHISSECEQSCFSTASCLSAILAPLWLFFFFVVLVPPSICSNLSSKFYLFFNVLCLFNRWIIMALHSFLFFVALRNTYSIIILIYDYGTCFLKLVKLVTLLFLTFLMYPGKVKSSKSSLYVAKFFTLSFWLLAKVSYSP